MGQPLITIEEPSQDMRFCLRIKLETLQFLEGQDNQGFWKMDKMFKYNVKGHSKLTICSVSNVDPSITCNILSLKMRKKNPNSGGAQELWIKSA